MSEDTNTGSTPVHQPRNCSTCKTGIKMADDVFLCVCCGKVMHLSVQCTGIPEDAIAGIQLISLNVLLLCNYCVERNRRDVILNDLASNRSSDASALLFDTVVERVNVIEKIVTETAEKLFATSQTEYPLYLLLLTTVAPPHATSPLMSTDTGIRVRGIPEVDKPNHHERYKSDMEEARKLLQFLLGSNADIADIRRLGKFEKNRCRPLLVKFPNAWQPRLALISRSKLKQYENQIFFIDKELSPAKIQRENALLLKRRELIGQVLNARASGSEIFPWNRKLITGGV